MGTAEHVAVVVLHAYFTAAKVSEYFVAMPNTPVIHIQNHGAPGRPR